MSLSSSVQKTWQICEDLTLFHDTWKKQRPVLMSVPCSCKLLTSDKKHIVFPSCLWQTIGIAIKVVAKHKEHQTLTGTQLSEAATVW